MLRNPGRNRQHILDAAERVAQASGIGRVTIREVAREAGCAEGSIYNYFADRADLLVGLVSHRSAALYADVDEIVNEPGDGSVADRLEDLMMTAINSLAGRADLSAALLADREVLNRYRQASTEHHAATFELVGKIVSYLQSEQDRHRVAAGMDTTIVALMIASVCHQVALQGHLSGVRHPAEELRPLCRRVLAVISPALGLDG